MRRQGAHAEAGMQIHPRPKRGDENVVTTVALLRIFPAEIAAKLRELAARHVDPHPDAHVLEVLEEVVA